MCSWSTLGIVATLSSLSNRRRSHDEPVMAQPEGEPWQRRVPAAPRRKHRVVPARVSFVSEVTMILAAWGHLSSSGPVRREHRGTP